MDPLALPDEQDFTEIKLEPPEQDDNSIICVECNPPQTFATFKDKVLHDFFQHAQVTSVMEEHIEIKKEEIKDEEPAATGNERIDFDKIGSQSRGGSRFKSYQEILNSSPQPRPSSKPKPSKKATRRYPHLNPVINPFLCDSCDFKTYYKMNIIKHVKNKHPSFPIAPKKPMSLQIDPIERVCLVCGQTMDRKRSLHKHYVRMHGNLLGICSVDDFQGVEHVKKRLIELKKKGEWTEPTRVIPVKRTKRYRYLEWSDDSGEDTEDYYKSYHGPLGISTTYHSSSDEYEEVFVTSSIDHECPICGKVMQLKKSMRAHMKKHLDERAKKEGENSQGAFDNMEIKEEKETFIDDSDDSY